MRRAFRLAAAIVLLLAAAGQSGAQSAGNAVVDAQQAAMRRLAMLDGTWRGTASVALADGTRRELVQTERSGAALDGTLRFVEGRGYAADGRLEFHAIGVISYSPQERSYSLRTYTRGRQGDYPLDVRDDGFSWTQRHGPVTIRHTATIRDGTWTEISERLADGQPAVRMIETRLQRVGDTDWPEGGAVPPR